MKKSNQSSTNETNREAWGRFLFAIIKGLITKRGLDGYEATDDNWDWEESEEQAGAYWVTYFAKDEADAAEFGKAVTKAAKRRGWKVDSCNANWAESVAIFGTEKRGKNKGRTHVEWFISEK